MLVWHLISQICCVRIGPSVDIEHDIMSKSGAGGAGGVFFCCFFEISRNGDFRN